MDQCVVNVQYYQKEKASVSIEDSSFGDARMCHDISLFTACVFHALNAIRNEAVKEALVSTIERASEDMTLGRINQFLRDTNLKLVTPRVFKHQKGISYQVMHAIGGNKARLKVVGIRLMGEDLDYYVSTSVLFVYAKLLKKHKNDARYINAIIMATEQCAQTARSQETGVSLEKAR